METQTKNLLAPLQQSKTFEGKIDAHVFYLKITLKP